MHHLLFTIGSLYFHSRIISCVVVGIVLLNLKQGQSSVLNSDDSTYAFRIYCGHDVPVVKTVTFNCVNPTGTDGNNKQVPLVLRTVKRAECDILLKILFKTDPICLNFSSRNEERTISFHILPVHDKGIRLYLLGLDNKCLIQKNASVTICTEPLKNRHCEEFFLTHSALWKNSNITDFFYFNHHPWKKPVNKNISSSPLFTIEVPQRHISCLLLFDKYLLLVMNHNFSVQKHHVGGFRNLLKEKFRFRNWTLNLQYDKTKFSQLLLKDIIHADVVLKIKWNNRSIENVLMMHSFEQNHRIRRDAEDKVEGTSSIDLHSENFGGIRRPKFNETAYRLILKKEAFNQRIRIEAEWAYLCLVFLISLILLSIWCMRGFHSRNTDKRSLSYSDKDNYLTVKEVLYRKAAYLPMFNHQGQFEEVFVHDCGTNTV